MFTVHGTKKFLDRVARPGTAETPPTTALGNWYATAVFWKPHAALFVNEKALLPVVVPLAPAVKVIKRFPTSMAAVLEALGIEGSVIASEVAEMATYQVARTQSRSLLGSMNDFVHLGKIFAGPRATYDPLALSLELASVPCGPLYGRHVRPDDELRAFVAEMISR